MYRMAICSQKLLSAPCTKTAMLTNKSIAHDGYYAYRHTQKKQFFPSIKIHKLLENRYCNEQ